MRADCPAGTFDQSGGCVPCPPGRWCPGGSKQSIAAVSNACGPNQISRPGATVETDCVCTAGGHLPEHSTPHSLLVIDRLRLTGELGQLPSSNPTMGFQRRLVDSVRSCALQMCVLP
jgi:hypothetical protein